MRSFSVFRSSRLKPFLAQCTTINSPSTGRLLDGGPVSPIRATRTFSHDSPRYPDAPSSEHNDLASYAAYAARIDLDVKSNTYIGTHYEYTVAASLKPLGFGIKRIGGRSDYGTDLLGTWDVPSSLSPLRVLIQCKATAQGTKIGPNLIRELEGAFIGAPPGWRGSGVMGFLATQKPATKGIRESLGRSRWPMGYVSCSKDGKLEQLIWNRRAEEIGLDGMGVNVHFRGDGSRENQHLVLMWRGRPYVVDQPSTDEPKDASMGSDTAPARGATDRIESSK